MMRHLQSSRPFAMAGILWIFLLGTTAAHAAGTFRFLTQSLPNGTTNQEYFVVLETANAGTPTDATTKLVTFAVSTCSLADPNSTPSGNTVYAGCLPPGLSLDANLGYITGKPSKAGTYNGITITATDSQGTAINFNIASWSFSAAGGGGNGGLSLATKTLNPGTVGVPYSQTLLATAVTGTAIWGAQNLPIGLSLNGLTGEITGTPAAAGTFYVTFTLTDYTGTTGSLKVITTIPITITPPASSFKFATFLLDNGEVGTAYSDQWFVTGAAPDPTNSNLPSLTFGASGLPTGLAVDPATGVVSGTPTVAGTYSVTLTAHDNIADVTITTNLWMWIAPSSTSNFYWDYFGIPTALYGVEYGQTNFPIYVVAKNGVNVSYSAIGLPTGISYNSSTGELSGVSYEPGVYPVVFTATDNGTNPPQVLTLATEFIVLSSKGGDTNGLAVNLWVKQLKANAGFAGGADDGWNAVYIYNANRSAAKIFNPATDTFAAALGDSTVTLVPGTLQKVTSGTLGALSYASPVDNLLKGQQSVKVRIAPKTQTLFLSVANDNLGTTFPADLLPNWLVLGGKSFKHKELLDAGGLFQTPSGYRNAAFVVASGAIRTTKNLKLQMFLADPALNYVQGAPLKIRVLQGTTELLNKDLSALVDLTQGVDGSTGLPTFTANKTWRSDPAASNKLAKFRFESATGSLNLELKSLSLSAALSGMEPHLGIEVTMGTKAYFTSVTFFENATNIFTTSKSN